MSSWTGTPHKITRQQQKALHKYFELLATELNGAGYTVQLFLKQTVDLDWSGPTVKELIWRPLQKALVQKGSTTELDKTSDIDVVLDHLTRHLGEKFGLSVPFPVDVERQLEKMK